MYPDDLKYTREHEWARAEGDRVTVGITDYAQEALGDIVYVDVPRVGTAVSGGEAFGEVESTKSVSDLFSPVSGTIVERNDELDKSPELINSDPYGRPGLAGGGPDDRRRRARSAHGGRRLRRDGRRSLTITVSWRLPGDPPAR